jgi:hypothetical protein
MLRTSLDAFRAGWRFSGASMRPTFFMGVLNSVSAPRGSRLFEARQAVVGYLSGRYRFTDTGFQAGQFTVEEKAAVVASLPPDIGPVVLVRPSPKMLADMHGHPQVWTPEATA